jgi:hypothetical protein
MSRPHDLLARDISIWLSGESITGAADRAVSCLVLDDDARRTACAAIAVEDLVRGWYGGIPLPPPDPFVIERRRQRSLVSACITAVAASLLTAFGLAGSFDRALDVAEAWAKSGPHMPLATSSYGHLRQQSIRP